MKFSFHGQSKKHMLKKKLNLQFDARKYWVVLLCSFVALLAAELIYFSLMFWKTNEVIDAPAVPVLESNAEKIRAMEETLRTVEQAISERTGTELESE